MTQNSPCWCDAKSDTLKEMLPEFHAFFVRGEDNQEYGPVELTELREWVQENRAGLGTEVRIDAPGAAWQPWQNYPELIALLAEVNVTSLIPGQPGMVVAPMGRRIVAFLLDLVLICFLFLPIYIAYALIFMPDFCVQCALAMNQAVFSPPEMPLANKVVLNLIYDLIFALFITGFLSTHGQTPAKALMGLRVVDQYGQKPRLFTAFLRAVALIFSLNLFCIPFGYAFFNPQRRAFHDFMAGTYVVES